jgi:rubrerythrin
MTTFNPFNEKAAKVKDTFLNWKSMYPKSYDGETVSPFTKLRIILMNGTEYEAIWFSHQFQRHCTDNDIRRELALARRIEQQQQKRVSMLKPIGEDILETTIGYEHLAVDLTAILAAREPNGYVKKALDFALLEDFDHLYRYADLMDLERGVHAENLVGDYVEIMPGRPTISEHRFPYDDVRRFTDNKTADLITRLNIAIITAAEQQTMNYYQNQGQFYTSDLGRKLYSEIAMIEEQHVTHYGSLMDTRCTWLEENLFHEYVECYLYYSCMMDEEDKNIKKIWEEHLEQEIAHLHAAALLLEKYEKKHWQEVIPNGAFPELLSFRSNKDYVRNVLRTVGLTSEKEDYKLVGDLPDNYEFFKYQDAVNRDVESVASHKTIKEYIEDTGHDYRFEEEPHPVPQLRDRTMDNTEVGRV